MSFTDGKRRIATDAECKAAWSGVKNGQLFRCTLCEHRFKPGDGWRFASGGKRTRNLMVCDTCDCDDPVAKFVKLADEFNSPKFWSLRYNERDKRNDRRIYEQEEVN